MRRLLSLSAFALAVALTGTSQAQYVINTGTAANGSGATLADGTQDTRYNVTSYPTTSDTTTATAIGTDKTYVVNQNTFPFPAWFADSSSSKWIGPYQGGNVSTSTASLAGDYSFTTTFYLGAGVDVLTASISGGLWATDNAGINIILNGHSTGNTQTADGYHAFVSFAIPPTLDSTHAFNNGLNTITFVVHNTPLGVTNPVGLRVEGKVIANGPIGPNAGSVPEPASLVMFGTAFLVVSGVTWNRNRKAKAVPQS